INPPPGDRVSCQMVYRGINLCQFRRDLRGALSITVAYGGAVCPHLANLVPLGLMQLPACAPFLPAGIPPRPRWGRSETVGWQDG
ncbi:MAG: hypothetical protein WCK70_16900, partial [Chloroflexales bacterium]